MWSISATAAGGFYTEPIHLPEWVDVSRPISLFQTFRNPLDMITTGRVVEFNDVFSWVNPGGTVQSLTHVIDWLSPDFWAADGHVELLLTPDLTPTDPTFPGGTFEPGALLGCRSYRNSTAAADNFPHAIQLVASLRLLAYVRCQMVGCG